MNVIVPKTLWYETQEGDFAGLPNYKTLGPPDGARYQVSQFPTELRTCYVRLNDDGTSTRIMEGSSSWPEDLVLAMATVPWWRRIFGVKRYRLSEAILIAATACEACMNVLAHRYGLKWGYAEGSPEWKRAGTSCRHCRPEPTDN